MGVCPTSSARSRSTGCSTDHPQIKWLSLFPSSNLTQPQGSLVYAIMGTAIFPLPLLCYFHYSCNMIFKFSSVSLAYIPLVDRRVPLRNLRVFVNKGSL